MISQTCCNIKSKTPRQSGVLLHISSLYGDFGCGSFGKEAFEFVDFLSECGFSLWQTLPFCMPDEYGSPYKSHSAFGANPYFIDIPTLYASGYITRDEMESAKQFSPYKCEYSRLQKERMTLLMKASKRAEKIEGVRDKIKMFLDKHKELNSAANFFALRESNQNRPWQKWDIGKPDSDTAFLWQFIQYEFFNQWMRVKDYATSRGIKVIGDVPIYVSQDSADVWANPDEFLLDKNGYPTEVAGVPPDYFSENGQLWGNPLYNYEKMKPHGFSFWKRRIEYMLLLFDGVRIDHFRAFESYWSIPKDAENAKAGRWVIGPGKAIIDVIKGVSREKTIIAEDLGDITQSVTELREYSTFPGMRVLQFGFLGDEKSPHLPHNYEKNTVAYTGTHDNNTLLGYIMELDSYTRERVFDYFGCREGDVCEAIIRSMLASVADTVIFPIQDLLGFGADTRINTPGRAEGNWEYRVTREQLNLIDRKKYAYFNKLFGR